MNDPDSSVSNSPIRRWVAAPKSAPLAVPAVLGVYLFDGETVEWSWTHTAEGSYVSGYQLDAKLPEYQPTCFVGN